MHCHVSGGLVGLALRGFLGVRGRNVSAASHKHEDENRRLQFDTNGIAAARLTLAELQLHDMVERSLAAELAR
jgi:hypothetical protein